MVKLAFITGITGQDGSYLAELLIEKGYKVYGIVRRTSLLFSHTRLDHIRDKIHLEYGDMSDGSSLTKYITNIVNNNDGFEVFEIYNLAAQSHVQISFEIPEYTSLIDGLGTLKVLEAIRTLPEDIQKKSWRSRSDLVHAVNAIFVKAFPDLPMEQIALEPAPPKVKAKEFRLPPSEG
jgi:GDPmannose 4,6-dehydratase